MANKVKYYARNFEDIRSELINYVKQYYPDTMSDFNDASIGMMLLEMNAAVGDMLSHHTDRMFQETMIDFAQERRSLLALARTFGLKVPGKRPSVTICDYTINIPQLDGDTFDVEYAPIIRKGSKVSGAGQIFENLEDIDFSSPFNSSGNPNRPHTVVRDTDGTLLSYTLTKQELVINGTSKIYKKVITSSDSKPFLDIILPEKDVLSVESVIVLDGTNHTTNPANSKFLDDTNKWYEVDALAQDKIFVEDTNRVSNAVKVRPGKWNNITKKFVTEYTDQGFLKITFGGGMKDSTSLKNFATNTALVDEMTLLMNNLSLGETLPANSTVFVKYRVGGGTASNIGVNIITTVGESNISVYGQDNTINSAVKASLTVNNTLPAMGGSEELSTEELRNIIKYNFSAQNRCVTIKDYQSRIRLMPGRYGVPFRCGVEESQNKIKTYILGLDANGKLDNSSNSTLKENISNYLSDFRMMNDYISINDGKILNLEFEADLFVDKAVSKSEIIGEVIDEIKNYMDINNHEMGKNIYMSQLIEKVNNVGGVLNVIDLRVYNKVGGQYSLNETSQAYRDSVKKQIDTSDEYTLFGEPNTMYEVKYPNKDIKVRIK